MKLEALELKGMLRFADRFRLDLRSLPNGLIAIVGLNGEGKTTLLEALLATLWREFPSRAGSSLYDCAHGRDAYLLSEFAIEGRGAFSARVSVDAVGRNTDAVISAVLDDGALRPLTESKGSKQFDAWVDEHLPSLDLVLAGAFAAQFRKRGNIVQLSPKGRKELFVEALALQHLEQMAQTATAAATLVEQAVTRAATERDLLARDCGSARAADLDAHACGIEERRTGLLTERDRHATRMAAAERAHSEAVDRAQVAARVQEQHRQAVSDVRRADGLIADAERDQQRSAADRALDLDALAARHAAKVADLEQRIRNNQGLQDRAASIRAAAGEALSIEQDLARLSVRETDERAAVVLTHQRLQELDAEIASLRQQGAALARAEADAARLCTVPCGGAGDCASCEFLTSAISAKATIEDLTAAVAALPAREQARALEVQTLAAAERQVIETVAAIKAAGQRLADARERSKDLARLEACEARLAELRANRVAVERDTDEQRARLHASAQEQMARLAERLVTLREDCDLRQRDADRLAAELERLDGADAARVSAAADLRRAQQDQQAVSEQLAACAAQIEHVAQAREALAAREAEVARLTQVVTALQTELLDWQILARTLGRDGLQTLEIDAAGPTISQFTNELLQATPFGARFTVDLITQAAKTMGKGLKEVFDIQITDARSGGPPRDVSLLSGGEQAVVVECLMSAIACFVNVRSSMPIRTLWRDEPGSAMDEQNRAAYIPMLRKICEVGGFEQVLFITHDSEQANQADAQIYVHDGTAEILYPPYAERQVAA